MGQSKPNLAARAAATSATSGLEVQVALEYLAEAWNMAEEDGVDSEELAHASLFAALAALVQTHGETATAELVAALPTRIRAGEYNLDRSLQ